MAGLECGKFDLSNLSHDEYISFDKTTLWYKAEVDEKTIFYDNRPHAVIKFSNKLEPAPCEDQKALRFALGHIIATVFNKPDPNQNKNDEHKANNIKFKNPQQRQFALDAQLAVNNSDLNALGCEKPAVLPVRAVIPMRSNIVTYGPYASSNFNVVGATGLYGGTSIETNIELCPWVFGSVSLMNAVGLSLVESKALGLTKAETGSVTIPGLPIVGLSNLGAAVSNAGPNLSSMNFNFGSNGITTTYEFSTYTPKFGSLTTHQIEKIKTIAKNRQEQLKMLRSQAILQNKINRQIARRGPLEEPVQKAENNKPAGQKNTTQRVLMGETYAYCPLQNVSDDQSPHRTVVALGSLEKTKVAMSEDYENKAFMSLDGIFGPVSIKGGKNDPNNIILPRFTKYTNEENNNDTPRHCASAQQSQPPFTTDDKDLDNLDQYNLEIEQQYINPLTNKFEADKHHHDGAGAGHTIDILGRESTVPEKNMTTLIKIDDKKRYSDDYRFIGLKGPLVLHSWGYDTEGKPIPNEADVFTDCKKGDFKTESLKDGFLKNWLEKPITWPVGPIDLRYDRKRGVWVTPPGYKIVVAKLQEYLPAYGTAKATLINKSGNTSYGDDLWDDSGTEVNADLEGNQKAYIKIADRIGLSICKGLLVYAYYDTFKSEYLVVGASVESPPTIATAVAEYEFQPTDATDIQITKPPEFPSSDHDQLPLLTIFNNAKINNPMGYGAKVGDYVTIQRTIIDQEGSLTDAQEEACSYDYIVIGVGKPPKKPT